MIFGTDQYLLAKGTTDFPYLSINDLNFCLQLAKICAKSPKLMKELHEVATL
jgi:hypothetical protein